VHVRRLVTVLSTLAAVAAVTGAIFVLEQSVPVLRLGASTSCRCLAAARDRVRAPPSLARASSWENRWPTQARRSGGQRNPIRVGGQ
jgi:hypothetical protein